MLQLKKILVPVDFSDGSLIAAHHAGALARQFGSEVTLLHVNEFLVVHPLTGPLGFGVASWETIRTEHLASRRKELDAFATVELCGVPVKRLVYSGDPARLIVEHARNENSDLIMMPTRGTGPLRRCLLGSVTAKVLHDAECPVWTGAHVANSPALTPTDLKHVMCAVDFGPQSPCVVRWAAALAASLSAKLTVVHAVMDTPPSLPDRYAFQWHEEAHFGARERLNALLIDTGTQADSLVVGDGDVPRTLACAAKEKGAGVMVIGRSRVGHAPKRLGSQTYAIIYNAPCAVVSI